MSLIRKEKKKKKKKTVLNSEPMQTTKFHSLNHKKQAPDANPGRLVNIEILNFLI
jgi:hypothetical protein